MSKVRARAGSNIGLLETQICTEFGHDLYEVKDWPTMRKLVYGQHLAMLSRHREQQMDHGGEMPEMPSGVDMPSNMPSQMPSGPSMPTDDVHPAIARYKNRIDVQNPGESLSEEVKQNLRDNSPDRA